MRQIQNVAKHGRTRRESKRSSYIAVTMKIVTARLVDVSHAQSRNCDFFDDEWNMILYSAARTLN